MVDTAGALLSDTLDGKENVVRYKLYLFRAVARCFAILAFVTVSASSAFAQGCSPPAGMDIRQWYSLCGPALQQAYDAGMGQGLPYNAFVQQMFQVYAQPVRSVPMQPAPGGGGMMCPIGASQCFNGYYRSCQPMATGGSWWVTTSQQCR